MAVFPIGAKILKKNEVRSFHFSKAFIGQETPRAVTRWEFYEYNVKSWKEVFRIPYICTKSTILQTLKYHILHRYIPTRRYLFIKNVVDAPHGFECQQIDTPGTIFVQMREG